MKRQLGKSQAPRELQRSKAGFTLLELLIALAVLGGLLRLLAGLLQSTRHAYDVNEERSFEQQAAEAATVLLRYELTLKGYRGTDTAYDGLSRNFSDLPPGQAPKPPQPAIEVSTDQITARYYEDRFQSSRELTEATFKLESDRSALVRRVLSTFRKVARGIKGFTVSEFRLRDSRVAASLPAVEDLAGLTLKLTIVGGSYRDVTITFINDLRTPGASS